MPQLTADLRDDRDWLDAFRRGDPWALERVFRTYAPLAFHGVRTGLALRNGTRVFVDNRHEQEDVVQEVFLRLLKPEARARYDGLRPYGVLVHVVVRNTLVDHLRRQSRLRELPLLETDGRSDAAPPDHAAAGPLPDEVAMSNEQRAAAQQVYAELSVEEQRFAQVRFVDGLSQRDTAQALGLGRQVVRRMEDEVRRKARQVVERLRGA